MLKATNIQYHQYLNILTDHLDCKGRVGFAIAHNYKIIDNAIQDYLQARTDIIKKYGDVQDDGSYIITDEEKLTTANAEFAEISSLEIELDITMVDEKDFMNCPELTARDMILLDWMVKKPQPKKEEKDKKSADKDESRFDF